MSIVERNDQIDRAFHALEFAHLVTACGGMSKEVEAFGKSLNINVDLLKTSYAAESHGAKTIEQVAMEGVLHEIHTWIVEKKRMIAAALTGISAARILVKVAQNYRLVIRRFGSLPSFLTSLTIALVTTHVIHRGILGLFNSLPGAITAALNIELPTERAKLAQYKQDVQHALKIRVWKEQTAKLAASAANADGKKFSADHPPSADDISSAIKSIEDIASTAEHLEFVMPMLEKMSHTQEASTPVGAAALRWLVITVTGMITSAEQHAGKMIRAGTNMKNALDKHQEN